MPKFHVEKGHDAWQRYFTIVEAESAEEAERIAGSRDYKGDWFEGPVQEFDDFEIMAGDTVQVDDEGDSDELITIFTIDMTEEEHATILAALRLWKDDLIGESPDNAMLEDIATNGGKFQKLEADAVERLCEKLNG